MNRKLFGGALVCATAAIAVGLLIPVIRTRVAWIEFSHYLHGRAGNCSLSESRHSGEPSMEQSANVKSIGASSHVMRQEGKDSLWSTPLGEYWMPTASKDAIVYDLAEQKRRIYGSGFGPGAIVLDAGANVGVFTRTALRAGAAKVVAIEPAPENLECLRRNFAREVAEGRVVIYPKGVWDKDDVLKMKVDPKNSAGDTFVRDIGDAQFVEAQLTTIDKLVGELGLPRVDFIKMDIEGAERRAIAGAKNTIARFHPRMALCIYHVAGDERAVPDLVRAVYAGYKVSKTCFCALTRIQPEVAFFN